MADGEWENEDFDTAAFNKPVLGDRWEGEDEDDDIKDNWDDEEEAGEKDEKSEQKMVAVQQKKKKPFAQVLAEKEEKRRKELELKRKMEEKAAEEVLTPEEIISEKLRQQKLQEEADLELAKEAFGETEEQGINQMNPSTKEDFDIFRKALAEKISNYEKSVHYVSFLEDLCRDLCVNVESDDIKKIISSLTALANEKVKVQKSLSKKKKSKKATLNLRKDDDFTITEYGDEYDDFI